MITGRKEPELSLETVKYLVISSDDELEYILPVIESEPVISVDTETTGLDPYSSRVLLIQIGIPGMSYVVNCSKVDVKKLKPALESKTSLKLLQNAKFDYKMLKANFDISLCNIYCTMIAERLITVGYEYGNASLKVLSEKYAGIFLDKDIRKSFIDKETGDDFTPREIKYSALDAAVMFPIYEKQIVELEDRGLVEVALLELRVLPIVGDMELNGCLIDKEKWHNIVEEVRCRRDKVSKTILEKLSGAVPQKNIFGLPEINLDSQQQLLACLHKLKVKGKGGKLLENTSEESLSEAKDKHPVVKDILRYRGDEKIITAYGLRFLDKIHPKTGRLHADFNQLRAETGRFSSSNPNLQQIPGFDPNDPTGVDFRGCFAATPGYKMLCADYSQQEIRVLADASDDPSFREAYINDVDIHKFTASRLFQCTLDEVTKQQRTIAKTINFLIIYGGGAFKLSRALEIPEDEAAGHIERYFKMYPLIRGFLNKVAADALKNRYSSTITGRKRYYEIPEKDDPEYSKIIARIRRQASNHFVQGSSSDITKQALIYVDDFIRDKSYDARILMCVHDEIVMECKAERAEEGARDLEDAMLRGFTHFFKKIPMKVEAIISDCWSKG